MSNTKNTKIVAGFPGVGKTFFAANSSLDVADSDNSLFSKSEDFPENYIEHIKSLMGKKDVIMVSTHKEVRQALVDHGLPFILVYPTRDQKEAYLSRFRERGCSEQFIELLGNNFYRWTNELTWQRGCTHVLLQEGEYLSDREYWIKNV